MVTLAEVAQHAGVSASTVSYVLSGKRSISASTRERVEHSIQQLGYHPNAGARALASSRSNIIALMVPLRTDMYVPVMMEIAIAVATTARTHGYDVLLLTGEEGPAAVRRIAGSSLADAMILMDVELHDERLPLLRESGRAAVLIGLPADTTGLTCVDLDFEATGALCVEHLTGLGHREIAVIGEAAAVYERHTGFAERTVDGIRAKAQESGARVLHRPCEGGYAAMAGDPEPDLRRAAGHDRVHRAERGRRRAAAQPASAAGPRRAGGRVRRGHLPRAGSHPGLRASHLRRHSRPGDGPPCGRTGGGQACRPRHGRSGAVGAGVDGPSKYRTGSGLNGAGSPHPFGWTVSRRSAVRAGPAAE